MERENKIAARLVHYWEVAGEKESEGNRGPYGISLSSIAPLTSIKVWFEANLVSASNCLSRPFPAKIKIH